MNGKCLNCQENEITHIKRGLCRHCYTNLRYNGLLYQYPKDRTRLIAEHYPQELIADFKKSCSDKKTSLSVIARKYGFSRENARQLFERINGFKYTAIRNIKALDHKNAKMNRTLSRRDPRNKVLRYREGSLCQIGADAERKVLELCAAIGYEVKPFINGNQIDLVINGYNVEVKSSHRTTKTSPRCKTPLYHFALSKQQRIADFVICYAAPMNNFFVIPYGDFPQGGHLYLPEKEHREWVCNNRKITIDNKYYQYLEAWNLLKPRTAEIVFSQARSLPTAQAVNE